MSLGNEISRQTLTNARPLWLGAIVLSVIALTPGLPKLPFFALSAALVTIAPPRSKPDEAEPSDTPPAPSTATARPKPEDHIGAFVQHNRACVEIGVRLIPLVDDKQGKGLAERIGTLRGDLTRKFGIWVPSIRMRDSLHLHPEAYRILIGGREVARGELRHGKLLAISSGGTAEELDGDATTDPAFGLPARWIDPHMQQRAEMKGYTVVDASTVLITHLGEVLRRYAHELLSREDMRKLLDHVREHAPTIVEELKPDLIRMGELHQVLVLLLQEKVPLTNLTRILETIVQLSPHIKSPSDLAEGVRVKLGRDILDRLRDDQGRVAVMVLEPRLEARLREYLKNRQLMLPHDTLERLVTSLNQRWENSQLEGREIALLTDTELRRPMRQSLERSLPDLTVAAYAEVPGELAIDIREIVKLEEVVVRESSADAAESASQSPTEQTLAAIA